MRRHLALVALTSFCLSACGLASNSSSGKYSSSPTATPPEAFAGPVPRAECGAGSHPETDIQGRVSAEDRASGRYLQPYNCNLELIGHAGDGANWQMAWFDDCAYYSTTNNSVGVQVVDVRDSAKPKITEQLKTPAFMDPWESLKTPAQKALLAGVGAGAAGGPNFDIYDVSVDCSHPRLYASLPVNGVSHEGNFAPDGRTYYGAGFLSPEVMVIDTTNPTLPHQLEMLPVVSHGLDLSPDSNTLYTANWTFGANGLYIYDVSLINRETGVSGVRTAGAPAPLIGFLTWSDGAVAQQPLPVFIKGHPYIVFTDEGGGGMTRIIDIADPANPVIVSKLWDEINMPDAASLRTEDGDSGFAYQGHYCGVDSREEATTVACSYFWQGIRVFDIRDPAHPKEIAYYIPAGDPENRDASKSTQKGCSDKIGMSCTSAQVRFVKEKGELWFTNQIDGFNVLKFTNGAWPLKD